MPIAIRPAAESDLPALAALESACFAHPWSEKSLAETLGNGRSLFLLAEREGEALGYLGADALLNELLRRAKGLGLATVTLEVRETNAPAIALYQKTGFVPVGRRKNYYTSPTEDAILMTVTL